MQHKHRSKKQSHRSTKSSKSKSKHAVVTSPEKAGITPPNPLGGPISFGFASFRTRSLI